MSVSSQIINSPDISGASRSFPPLSSIPQRIRSQETVHKHSLIYKNNVRRNRSTVLSDSNTRPSPICKLNFDVTYASIVQQGKSQMSTATTDFQHTPYPDIHVPNAEDAASHEPVDGRLDPPAHEPVEGLMDPPAGGYEPIQGITLLSVLQNVDKASYKLWIKHTEPSLLVYLPRDRPQAQGDSTPKALKIANVVRSAFPAQSNVQVAAPKFTDAGDGQIYPFWITGLTYQQVETLLARKIWSTPSITFICIPFYRFSTPYTMTVENLSLSVDADGEVKAATVIKEGMKANRTLLHFIRRHMSAILDDPVDCLLDIPTFPALTAKTILTHIIQTVTSRGQVILQPGGRGRINAGIFHIYMKCFTNDPRLLDQWIASLKAVDYPSLNGTAIVRKSFTCTYCIGHDHPTGLCPLLKSTYVHDHKHAKTLRRNRKGKGMQRF